MSGWTEASLGEVCELYQPKTISSSELVEDGPFPVYGANGVIGKYDKFNHEDPQLLITCRGATCGAVNISQPKSWINGNAMVVKPRNKSIDVGFLKHLFLGGIDLSAVITGAAQPQITRQSLAPLKIRFPNPAEQQRLISILDQADALRAKRREALAQLDSLTQSIFIEMFGDPMENPKGFPVRSLGEIIKFEGGSQPPASTFTSEETPETIRLVQIRDFRTDRFKTFIPKNLSRRFFEADDVMIGRYGPPVFQILRGLSGSYNVALMKAVPRNGITKDFVYHLLKEKRLHNFVVANSERTAGQSGVNLELLEKYQAFIPPIEVQREFAKRVSMVDSLKVAMRCSLKESDILFASLQHRAFAGEL